MRVLIADDAPLERAIFARYAARAGWIVGEASDLATALAALEAEPANLVVLDGRLPPEGCLDALARVRAAHPGLPVLVVVAFEEASLLRAALRAGAAGALRRPLLPAQIGEQLRLVASRIGREAE